MKVNSLAEPNRRTISQQKLAMLYANYYKLEWKLAVRAARCLRKVVGRIKRNEKQV